MAGHAFDDWKVMPEAGKSRSRPELKLVAPLFDRNEYQVIEIARRDSVWSIRPRSKVVRLVGHLFGIRPQNPLAAPRLEAIRRYAVAARADTGNSHDRERQLFEEAGFTSAHADFIKLKMNEKLPLSLH